MAPWKQRNWVRIPYTVCKACHGGWEFQRDIDENSRCRKCNATAKTPSSLASLRPRSLRICAPTRVVQELTAAYFRETLHTWVPVADERVAVALDVADQVLPPPAAPSSSGPGAELVAFAELGHDVFRVGDTICCRRCAGHCTVQSSHTARKLRHQCGGLSNNPSTRRNQLTAVDRTSRGLPPRQRGNQAAAQAGSGNRAVTPAEARA